jgi:hypothetical protein
VPKVLAFYSVEMGLNVSLQGRATNQAVSLLWACTPLLLLAGSMHMHMQKKAPDGLGSHPMSWAHWLAPERTCI